MPTLVLVPRGEVTLIMPGLALAGTLVEVCVSELMVNVAVFPLKASLVTKVKLDRKSTRLNSSHSRASRMPSSA